MRIGVVGYGAMGQLVCSLDKEDLAAVVGLELAQKSLEDVTVPLDVIIDFSHPDNLDMIVRYAKSHHTPVVFATTGYQKEQLDRIRELSLEVPVLQSSNFSLGVILLNRIVREITPILKDDFDIEIVEAHHHHKQDAPSGTAKMLLASVEESTGYEACYGRKGVCPRKPREVGVHAIRGGSIVGEHTVLYCGENEVLKLSHHAESKKIFAIGALKAAKFLMTQPTGFYTMEDVLFG